MHTKINSNQLAKLQALKDRRQKLDEAIDKDNPDNTTSSHIKKSFNIPEISHLQQKHKQPKHKLRIKQLKVIFKNLFAIFLFCSMLIVAYYIYSNFNSHKTDNPKLPAISSSQTPPSIDLDTTGGSNTPATLARKNDSHELSQQWLIQNFRAIPNTLDNNNSCIKLNICSPDSDPDNDGLVNLYEYNFGTDPNDADTDKDGLGDGNELFIYYTDPLAKDSNKNSLNDTQEILSCHSPITQSSDPFSESELQKIQSNVAIYPLREPFITQMKLSGASIDDIKIRGYIKDNCNQALQKIIDNSKSVSAQ